MRTACKVNSFEEIEAAWIARVRLEGTIAAIAETVLCFAVPQKVAGATKYTRTLTVEGEDPNKKNNTFTEEQRSRT